MHRADHLQVYAGQGLQRCPLITSSSCMHSVAKRTVFSKLLSIHMSYNYTWLGDMHTILSEGRHVKSEIVH